jgi:hypothetical protein
MGDYQPVSFAEARSAAIALRSKFTNSTKGRECPPVFLIFNFKKAPSKSSGPHRLVLPHPVRKFPFHSGIVFVKGEVAPWNDLLSLTSLPLSAVSLSQLKKKYTSQKSQYQLFKSADYFFCDRPAAAALPGLLISPFFSRKRQPVVVDLAPATDRVEAEVRSAVESSELYVKSDIRCFLRVGAFNLTFDAIAENILSAVEQAMRIIPKAKARVQSISMIVSRIEMPPFWQKHPKRVALTVEEIRGQPHEDDTEE